MENNVELFRKELMKRHAHDWTMETISEAAHICADALIPVHSDKLLKDDTPDKARFRYKNNGFGKYGSPSAKKTFNKYMQLFVSPTTTTARNEER